jgi:uncharacterized protein YndB with AHSA1/START domain
LELKDGSFSKIILTGKYMTKRELRITRLFNAPREVVWKMWTEPEQIMKWWGPEGFTAPSIKVDLRVGGKYIFAMQGPAGSPWGNVMYSAGTYKEIMPMEKIVASEHFSNEHGDVLRPDKLGMDPNFPSENIVTITFEEEGGKTKLTILYTPESDALYEAMVKSGMEEGWGSALLKLDESLLTLST